jgi:hypothetical protein
MPSTPAQVLQAALDIANLVEVDITMIELTVEKTKDERAIENTEILENTVIAEPVHIAYLGSSSDEAGSESNSNNGSSEFGKVTGQRHKN